MSDNQTDTIRLLLGRITGLEAEVDKLRKAAYDVKQFELASSIQDIKYALHKAKVELAVRPIPYEQLSKDPKAIRH
jgi:hypothetical protein